MGKSVDFQGFSGCLGWVFGEGLEGFGVVYWVYNRCILGFLCMFMRFLWGLCKVYAVYSVYCIFIGGTVYQLFTVPPSGVWWAFRCWWVAGSGSLLLLVGVGSGWLNLKESRCFKLVEKSLKIGGILHFFGVFGGLKSLRLVHLFTHN